jgi:hypothetical protein
LSGTINVNDVATFQVTEMSWQSIDRRVRQGRVAAFQAIAYQLAPVTCNVNRLMCQQSKAVPNRERQEGIGSDSKQRTLGICLLVDWINASAEL